MSTFALISFRFIWFHDSLAETAAGN